MSGSTNTSKVALVMPAFNAERTLAATIEQIHFDEISSLIIVDDASSDGTVREASRVISEHPQLTSSKEEYEAHPTLVWCSVEQLRHNSGYGANQKRCYTLALATGADIIVMLHPDNQYDPTHLNQLIAPIREGKADVMLGSRMQTHRGPLSGGMPRYKYWANKLLGWLENRVTGQSITDWHTGYRAYTHTVLSETTYDAFSNDFLFDTQMLLALCQRNSRIGEIPIPTRYFPEASSIGFVRSCVYGLGTLYELLRYTHTKPRRIQST